MFYYITLKKLQHQNVSHFLEMPHFLNHLLLSASLIKSTFGSLTVIDRSVENNIPSCLFLSGTYLLCQGGSFVRIISPYNSRSLSHPPFHCTLAHHYLLTLNQQIDNNKSVKGWALRTGILIVEYLAIFKNLSIAMWWGVNFTFWSMCVSKTLWWTQK